MVALPPRPDDERRSTTRLGAGRDAYNAEVEGRPQRWLEEGVFNPEYRAWGARADAWVARDVAVPQLRIGSLFSGYGGLDLATEAFFGARTVWHAEVDAAPSRVLAARFPGVPNLGDVTRVPWHIVAPVHIMTGGFPCQDLSLSGRRAGMRKGTRSGLWSDFVKAIAAVQPQVVIIENVRGLLSGCAESDTDRDLGLCPRCLDASSGVPHAPNLRALGRVLGDLAELGFDAEWGDVRASDVGAPHARFRVFVLAYRSGVRRDWAEAAGLRRTRPEIGDRATLRALPTPRASRGASATETARLLMPTPTTDPASGNGHARDLGGEVRLIPTTTAQDAEASGGSSAANVTLTDWATGRRGLVDGAALMPTPQVADATGGHASRSGARSDELLLPGVATQAQRTGFGPYEAAVRRWEGITRDAPPPTLADGREGAHRLNAAFAEWMMGLPEGWVTDVLDRTAALKALGNGVVPQQAHAALGALWRRVDQAVAA